MKGGSVMNVQQKSVNEFLRILARRWAVITAITLFFTASAGLISFFVLSPEYEATAKVLVNEINAETATDTGDAATSFYQMETSFKLFETFMVIAQSPQVLDKVVDNLGLRDSYSQMSEKVAIDRVGESLVIEIKANASNPNEAVNIVNEISKVLNQEISKIYGENQLSVLKTGGEGDVVTPVNPKPMLNMIAAFLAGLVISVVVASLLEWFKKPQIQPAQPQAQKGPVFNSKLFSK
ncbi:hypothetical protein B1B05_05150 [Domibacillus enclensis]|uniref:Polysaccharide chain length determinant N-terminal domain-containing protein n=2 Tax=Domibacillus enclensis TaxID=1017273 RepID=A0ABX4EB20_9BACI|nr:hypothetical protein B1B05_05150 [Domibacillus enclensis]